MATKLIILGAGESGVGSAILGQTKGMDVFVSDNGPIPEKYVRILQEYNIPFEQNGHTPERVLQADLAIKSPGIPPTAPLVKALAEKGVPILSEIEFAGRYTNACTVCITGSNGKTTTTLLTYHILRQAGLDVGLAGNVGKSMARQVAEDDHDYYVIELSSFQLENMYDFRADIAILLNITPDHLDRYDHKMENYVDAKFRILQNLTPLQPFIYWEGDPVVTEKLRHTDTKAMLLPFSEQKTADSKAWVDSEDVLHFDLPDNHWTMQRDRLALPGLHNLYNSMAAGMAATMLGLKPEQIEASLADFQAVEHRLEYVADVDGARWVNDSKATNVNSTWYALESMTTPVVLILGGKDKGNDYSEILPLVQQKVHTIVCMGVDNTKLLNYFGDKGVTLVDTHSLDEAVNECRKAARPGDTVLLSPCCASFDLFHSYEERGELFKNAVHNLTNSPN